jgi:hypothetical protein
VGCPTPADEFRRAVAVAIADAPIRLAQDEAECDAWAGYAQFTNGLHAVTLCRSASMTGLVAQPGSQCLLLCPWLGSTGEAMTVGRARSASGFTVATLNFRTEDTS